MKKVLGLDLGTTSIGWGLINQAENKNEKSSIIRAGVRVNPLSSDELGSFERGKAISTNSDRTLKRGARRNLQRYKLRRDTLISIMKENSWIDDSTILSEEGGNTTYETYRLRAKAASEEISLSEFARILLMINKKRGYKSSRKTTSEDEGHLIDGMAVAKQLYEEGLTPAQYCLRLLESGKKYIPDFYRSDLNAELDSIWTFQSKHFPNILTDEFKAQIIGKSKTAVNKIFYAKYGISTADNKGKDRRRQGYQWRSEALNQEIPIEQMAYVICDICGEISGSSGYLGAIGDRSKELFFEKLTVGQYLFQHITDEPGYTTKNVVFYRQDYLDEFETIWECQARFHKELTPQLKSEIRDIVIFYQRRLKSQKGLINFCEFEKRDVNVTIAGKIKTVTHGCKVAPRSSLLFQEFKIWQRLNDIVITFNPTKESRKLELEEMQILANELSIRSTLSDKDALAILFGSSKGYEMNFHSLSGNETLSLFFKRYMEIVDLSGHGSYDINKLGSRQSKEIITEVFQSLGFSTSILAFDSSLPKEQYEQQPLFKLWHLLYSYEGDGSKTGDKSLIEKICDIAKMPEEYARILAGISFLEDYSSLSHKALRRILPYLKEGNSYDLACAYAGYRHSDYLTKEERESRPLFDRLPALKKNSLRNPVVEKILSQMINVVNAISDEYGKPDEIHIELARSLKLNAKQREAASQKADEGNRDNMRIMEILQKEFGITYVRKADIVRYKLYEELKPRGYKTLYSDKYIPREILFSKNIDIEHIIPQALLFDDSFSNKTLEYRDVNLEKGKMTARDYVTEKYGVEGLSNYILRIEDLFKNGSISKAKRNKLLMKLSEIPSDFIARDLTCSQYIAKVSKEMLESFVRVVIPTTGKITEQLRKDWQLVDVMKEICLPKYEKAGRVFVTEDEDGHRVKRIEEWTKRGDHRHHAMDALTIAFTKQSHIQYLNTLSAQIDNHDLDEAIIITNGKKRLAPPMPLDELRKAFKDEIETVLVSIKAKNKVVTRNINKTKCRYGHHQVVALTPRGPLHKEQVYGQRSQYETFYLPVGGKLDADAILAVASKSEREALMKRLNEYDGNAKKAFTGSNSLEKNPLFVDDAHTCEVPAKVKCLRHKTVYSIRKPVDASLSVDKVLDSKIKQLLQDRISEFGGNQAKAFANLEENPIWLNKEKNIAIKRVTISENFGLNAIHSKRDKNGNIIYDENGNSVPTDYVNLKNNHHVAIYRDSTGNLQEKVVPFFEALERVSNGLPAVDRELNRSEGWKFLFSMKINEMFVFPDPATGFFPEEVDLFNEENYKAISQNLYRVQTIASKDYRFRHHLETVLIDDNALKDVTWKRIKSLPPLEGVAKVRINHLGKIVSVGEYD